MRYRYGKEPLPWVAVSVSSSILDSTRFQKLFHPTALIGSTDPDLNAVKSVKINTVHTDFDPYLFKNVSFFINVDTF